MEIKEENEQIIISKVKKQSLSLEERIKQYKGQNLAREFSWNEPQGKEIL